MRFLHVSDLHIGRRLNGFSMLDDQQAILSQLLKAAETCDAVLVAGDVYDKAQPSAEAIRMVGDFWVQLSRLQKPVFVTSGNHDAAEQVAYCRQLLGESGVFVSPAFDGTLHSYTLRDAFGEVDVWLMPFLRPAAVRPYHPDVRTYEEAIRAVLGSTQRDPAKRHVLVAHQYVSGAALCDSEMRLIGGLDQIGTDAFDGFDYVALGHLHSPQRLCGGRICYCGSPLKYSLSEEHHRKAAFVVEIGLGGEVRLESYPLTPLHEVRTVKGELAAISDPENYSEDYVYAVVTDEVQPFDPLGALRLTYPRLIGMRAENSRTHDATENLAFPEAEQLSPMEHFAAFYEAQNNGHPPDERRMALMRRIVEEAEEKQHATHLA